MSTEAINQRVVTVGDIRRRFQKHSKTALAGELAVLVTVNRMDVEETAQSLEKWDEHHKFIRAAQRAERALRGVSPKRKRRAKRG